MIKPGFQQPVDAVTFKATLEMLEANLKLLHPFMPFLTEEIWQHITERSADEALIIAKYPEIKSYDEQLITDFDFATEVRSEERRVGKECRYRLLSDEVK